MKIIFIYNKTNLSTGECILIWAMSVRISHEVSFWARLSFVSARPFFKNTHVFLLWSDNSGSYREITARQEVGENFIDNSIISFLFCFVYYATVLAVICYVVTQRFSLARCTAWQVLIWHLVSIMLLFTFTFRCVTSFHFIYFNFKASLNEAPREIGKYWLFIVPYMKCLHNCREWASLERKFIDSIVFTRVTLYFSYTDQPVALTFSIILQFRDVRFCRRRRRSQRNILRARTRSTANWTHVIKKNSSLFGKKKTD